MKMPKILDGETYDYAIPQQWCNAVFDETGIYPAGHVVWLYGAGSRTFGRPFAVDMLGWIALKIFTLTDRN